MLDTLVYILKCMAALSGTFFMLSIMLNIMSQYKQDRIKKAIETEIMLNKLNTMNAEPKIIDKDNEEKE